MASTSQLTGDWPTVYFARAMDDQDPADIRAGAAAVSGRMAERRMRLVDPFTGPETCTKSLVEADLQLLRGCSAVLMDMTIASRNYVGCVGELIYAYTWSIPVVVYVGASGNGRRHWLIYHAKRIVDDQEEALNVLQRLLYPRAGQPVAAHPGSKPEGLAM